MFRFKAVDKAGAEVFGEIDAASEVEATRDLKSRNLTVVDLSKIGKEVLPKVPRKASAQDINTSLHELVTLLEADVNLDDALESMRESNYPRDLSDGFKRIASEVKKGGSFSFALSSSGISLPNYLIQMAKAGEFTGSLAESLRKGLDQYEYELGLARDFKTALTYPIILIFSGLAAILFIFAIVVPKFLPMLERADDLPLLSSVIFSVGVFFNDNFFVLGLLFILFASSLIFLLSNRKNRERLFDFFSSWPILGIWLVETDITRWSSTLAALLASKVDLIDAIALANENIFSNRRRVRFNRVISHLKAGGTLADSLEKEQVLTPVGYNLIRSGEKAGKVPEMIGSLSHLYDESGKVRTKRVLSLIEPISILLIGIMIGSIVLGIMLAITSVNIGVI